MSDLREHLLSIRRQHGALTPRAVLVEAEPEDSPLHHHFEWDQEAAADAYRLEQARELIRSVMVVYTDSKARNRSVRGFVNVQQAGSTGREYKPIEEVAQDPFARQLVLREAERDWKALRSKYGDLQEFMDLVRNDVAV
jgi:hypothetical protein